MISPVGTADEIQIQIAARIAHNVLYGCRQTQIVLVFVLVSGRHRCAVCWPAGMRSVQT